jgi:hypothetical protein
VFQYLIYPDGKEALQYFWAVEELWGFSTLI